MSSRSKRLLVGVLLLAILLTAVSARAADNESGDPDAIGHSADGYYLNFEPLGSLELPRLFFVREADGSLGFDVYGSTYAALERGPYTLADADGNVLAARDMQELLHGGEGEHKYLYFPVVRAEGDVIIDFSISRQLTFVFLSAILLVILALSLARRYKRGIGRDVAPQGTWQNMMEVFLIFLRDEVAKPAVGPKYRKYLPYLFSVFFFILLGNLLGLVPWGVTATSNIMVTATLAGFTFVITQFAGTKDYWKHIFNPPGVPAMVKPFLVPVEFIGLFTKPLALAFRLFGNMVSGHLVIISLVGLIFIFTAQFNAWVGLGVAAIASVPLTVFIFVLKIGISFIQAYIFTMLSALFIGLALEEHDHEEHEMHTHDEILDRTKHYDPNKQDLVTDAEGQTALTQPAG